MYSSLKYEGGYGTLASYGGFGYGDSRSMGYGEDSRIVNYDEDSGIMDYEESDHTSSINNILLGFGSIMLFINIMMGLYICVYHNKKEKKKNRISMVNPMTRNGTIWTNCNANKE
jgi:hypothetical protein